MHAVRHDMNISGQMVEPVFLGENAPARDWALKWCLQNRRMTAFEYLTQGNKQHAINDISLNWVLYQLRLPSATTLIDTQSYEVPIHLVMT